MRILFVVAYTPTPIRTRPYNLLRTLARRGHAVTLCTLWENEPERYALEQLKDQGISVIAARLTRPRSAWNCLRALPTAMPLQADYCWHPELFERMQKAVGSRQHPFDAIHVEHLRGARYGVALRKELCLLPSGYRLPILWDSVDCISHLFEQAARNSRSMFGRVATRFELARTRRYEAWLVNQFDRVLVASSVDAEALQALVSGSEFQFSGRAQPSTRNQRPATICTLPNGVALDYFVPDDARRETETIVFTGKMSYHANVTAALHLVNDIMPLVWKERPGVRVQVVGKDPSRQVCALAKDRRLLVTGGVPDLQPFLQRATVAVAPMSYGAGIQNKVLEAMACATPVVATPQAVSALHACPEDHFLLANDPADFARQIFRLLDDADLQFRMGQAGRRYVEQHHNWDRIVGQLEGIYRDLQLPSIKQLDYPGRRSRYSETEYRDIQHSNV